MSFLKYNYEGDSWIKTIDDLGADEIKDLQNCVYNVEKFRNHEHKM